MKQYYLIVLVLLLNITFGYSNDCDEDGFLMFETTVRIDELDETTAVTADTTDLSTVTVEDTTELTPTVTVEDTTEISTVTDEDTTEITTVTDEDTTEITTVTDEDNTEVTTEEPTTQPPATTTQPLTTASNNPCETTTTCATTKKSTDELIPSIQNFVKSSDCLTLKSGTVLVDANHCRRYYVCSSGKAIRKRCPVGNWYDRKKLTCRLRDQVSNCPANRN